MTGLVHALLEAGAARTPDAPAIVDSKRTATYAELNGLANRFAHLFCAMGVTRGERVVIALENSVETVAAYLGAMKAGGVAVPLAPGPRNDRLPHAVADCGPRVAVINAATARVCEQIGTPHVFIAGPALTSTLDEYPDTAPGVFVAESDLAAIIYTSGSTGEPRGVMLSHRNFIANAQSIVSYLELTAADRVMCVLPFSYVYGLSLLHTHLAVGASVVIDNRFAFPNVVLDAMQQHRVTGLAGVPSSFALLLHRSKLDEVALPDLRYVTQAGGGMPVAQIREWLERGPRAAFFVMYGATEAAARLAYLPPARLTDKLGSIGRAIPGVEIVVVNDRGEAAAPNEVGELVARGDNIARGYWNRPAETAERFGPLGYRTGDLGYADDEGFLFLVGRRHDMIKVGAHRVGAREIEDVLHAHPSVHEAAVVSTPHELLGEVPVAFVAMRGEPAEPQALRAFCSSRLPAYKMPARVEVLSELPKLSVAGKIDRQALRERARQAVEVPS